MPQEKTSEVRTTGGGIWEVQDSGGFPGWDRFFEAPGQPMRILGASRSLRY